MDDVEIRWDACKARRSSCSELSYLRGRKAHGGPSGIAEREDMVMLGLGGSREDVEDDGERDTEFRDDRLLIVGISGVAVSDPSLGDNFERRVDALR